MRRGCVVAVIGLLGLCLLVCGLGYFVALPRVRESARNEIRDAIGTVVAQQIPAVRGTVEAGSYTLNEADIQQGIAENFDIQTVEGVLIRIEPERIAFVLSAEGGEEITYSGVPTVVNGRLEMNEMSSSEGFLDVLFPAGELGRAVEEAFNTYLDQNGLDIESIELTDGALTIVTVPAA